jgi:ubiquinol-cytochrome c reductase cytochrome b subunit
MLVFAGMFHLYRYGKNLPKSNIEVISSKGPTSGLSSFRNKMLGKDGLKKAIPAPTGSNVSSLPDNSGKVPKEEQSVEPEIKTSSKKGASSSTTTADTSSM